MGKTPKWERGAHLEISTDEKLDYLYTRDDAQQEQIDELIEGGEGGGGSDAFEVEFSLEYDEQEESYIATSDKTYSEISEASAGGKKIYAWMYYPESETEFLTTAYREYSGNFEFYFEDNTKIGGYKRFIVTVGSDYVYATVYSELAPVYMPGTYSNGDYLDETSLELFHSAIQYESLVYMWINVSYGEYGIYIFHHNYLETGYCIAGTRDASGATVRVDTDTGEITVTPA